MSKDMDNQRKKRRRSTRLQHRESLGLNDLKALSISEESHSSDIHNQHAYCLQEMSLQQETSEVDRLCFSTLQNDKPSTQMDTAEANCGNEEGGRKRQLSPVKTTPESVLPATGSMGDMLTGSVQAHSGNQLPSPAKLKKSSECNQQTQVMLSQELSAEDIILPFDEPSQAVVNKQPKRRSRRRSSDCFILDSNIISSPSGEVIDLPMGMPRTRRSSRLRRKSIEIFKHQQESIEDTVNSRGQYDDNVAEVTSKNGSSLNVDADSLEFTKLKIDEEAGHSSGVTSFSEHNGDLAETLLTEVSKKRAKRGRLPKSARHQETLESFEEIYENDNLVVPALKMCETSLTEETSVEEAPKKRAKRGRLPKSVEPEENLEELYKNKNFVAPTLKMWETIFESPMSGKSQKLVSAKKYKRLIEFEDFQPQKYKLRRQKALRRGWKAPTKKKREAAEKLLQSKMLELEMDELSVGSSESSQSSSVSELPPQDMDNTGSEFNVVSSESSRSSSVSELPPQDMENAGSEFNVLSSESSQSSGLSELAPQDMDNTGSEFNVVSNESSRSSSVSEFPALLSQDVDKAGNELEAVSELESEYVYDNHESAELCADEQMDIVCDKVRSVSHVIDSVEGEAMCGVSPASDLSPPSQEMDTDVFSTPPLAPVNHIMEPGETGEGPPGDVGGEECVGGSHVGSGTSPDKTDQVCVAGGPVASHITSDGLNLDEGVLGGHLASDIGLDRTEQECTLGDAGASDITSSREELKKCASDAPTSDRIDCEQVCVSNTMDRDTLSIETSTDNDSSVEPLTGHDECATSDSANRGLVSHDLVSEDLDESSNYESVKSNISDDSFQDFGNMTFDSSKEFPELLYDDTGNESALNTAIYLNTPPDSRESNCSVECSTSTLLQTPVSICENTDTNPLEDSLVSGSADILSCR